MTSAIISDWVLTFLIYNSISYIFHLRYEKDYFKNISLTFNSFYVKLNYVIELYIKFYHKNHNKDVRSTYALWGESIAVTYKQF